MNICCYLTIILLPPIGLGACCCNRGDSKPRFPLMMRNPFARNPTGEGNRCDGYLTNILTIKHQILNIRNPFERNPIGKVIDVTGI